MKIWVSYQLRRCRSAVLPCIYSRLHSYDTFETSSWHLCRQQIAWLYEEGLSGVSFDFRKLREDFIPFLPPGCVSWNFVTSKTSLLMIIQMSSDLLCDATSLWENTLDMVDCRAFFGGSRGISECNDILCWCKYKFKDKDKESIWYKEASLRGAVCAHVHCWTLYWRILLLYFAKCHVGSTLAFGS